MNRRGKTCTSPHQQRIVEYCDTRRTKLVNKMVRLNPGPDFRICDPVGDREKYKIEMLVRSALRVFPPSVAPSSKPFTKTLRRMVRKDGPIVP